MTVLEASNCKKPILLRDVKLYECILDGYYLKASHLDGFISEIKKLKEDKSYYNKAVLMADKCAKYYSEENVAKIWKSYYNRIYKNSQRKTWRKRRNVQEF